MPWQFIPQIRKFSLKQARPAGSTKNAREYLADKYILNMNELLDISATKADPTFKQMKQNRIRKLKYVHVGNTSLQSSWNSKYVLAAQIIGNQDTGTQVVPDCRLMTCSKYDNGIHQSGTCSGKPPRPFKNR